MSQATDKRWNGAFTDFKGQEVLGVTAPVDGTEWVVMTELSQAEARAVSRTMLMFNGGILVLGAIILFVTARFLTQSVFQPMERLRTGVERIGQGDLDIRIEVRRDDEIGQVATAFNKMTNSLQDREEKLIQARDRAMQLYADLKSSEKKYRTLFEDSHDAIFISSPEGDLLDINPAGLQLFGYTSHEAEQKSVGDFYVYQDDYLVFKRILFRQGEVKDFEALLRDKSTTPRDCLITAVLRQNEEAAILGYQGIIRDITVQKRAERERLKLSAIQQELFIAHDIQQSLLPLPKPDWPNLDVICYSNSAREVGGDFYQYHVFELTSGENNGDPVEPAQSRLPNVSQIAEKYALAIGDVSGKGVSAALLMATSLSQFDASLSLNFSPSERLVYLDRAISPYTKPRRQNCAICYVEIMFGHNGTTDQQTAIYLQAVNAGCIPPYVKRRTGEVESPEIGGFALGQGLGATLGYQELSLKLSQGDIIILTSDGVVEANNHQGDMLGFERLEAILQAGPTTSAEAMLEYLKGELFSFTADAEQHDDMTIVVVQV